MEKEWEQVFVYKTLRAVQLGTYSGEILNCPVQKPKGGSILVYKINSNSKDYLCDQYRWREYGRKSTGLFNKIYYGIVIGPKYYNKSLEFRRIVYEPLDQMKNFTVAIVKYLGNNQVYKPLSHGNAIVKNRPHVTTMPSTRQKIKDHVKFNLKPQCIYEKVQYDCKKEIDSLEPPNEEFIKVEATVTPRNTKQVENFKTREAQGKKVSTDHIYSLYEIAKNLEPFIRKIELYPNLVVVFGHNAAVELGNRLLKASKQNKELEQLISYDTTFELGDYYLSILTMCNTELEGNPIFPVLFMLHEKKFMEHHTIFWKFYANKLLKIERCGINVPIVTDREPGVYAPILAEVSIAKTNLVFCHNHILSDLKIWLPKNKATPGDFKGYDHHIADLLNCETKSDFDKLYDEYHSEWSLLFATYVDKYLKNDLLERAYAGVTNRFAAFIGKVPTNNISERLNGMVKERTEWKEMSPDAL